MWVVHQDDAAPSSGFEGIGATLEDAKAIVEACADQRWYESHRWHPPIPERPAVRYTVEGGGSIEAYFHHSYWFISEEEVRGG